MLNHGIALLFEGKYASAANRITPVCLVDRKWMTSQCSSRPLDVECLYCGMENLHQY